MRNRNAVRDPYRGTSSRSWLGRDQPTHLTNLDASVPVPSLGAEFRSASSLRTRDDPLTTHRELRPDYKRPPPGKRVSRPPVRAACSSASPIIRSFGSMPSPRPTVWLRQNPSRADSHPGPIECYSASDHGAAPLVHARNGPPWRQPPGAGRS